CSFWQFSLFLPNIAALVILEDNSGEMPNYLYGVEYWGEFFVYPIKKFWMLLVDILLVNLALLLTINLPYQGVIHINFASYLFLVIVLTFVRLCCLYYFGL